MRCCEELLYVSLRGQQCCGYREKHLFLSSTLSLWGRRVVLPISMLPQGLWRWRQLGWQYSLHKNGDLSSTPRTPPWWRGTGQVETDRSGACCLPTPACLGNARPVGHRVSKDQEGWLLRKGHQRLTSGLYMSVHPERPMCTHNNLTV